MKTFQLLMVAIILVSLAFACQQNEEFLANRDSNNNPIIVNPEPSPQYYSLWVYVMDARFSRATCATGPGVCFKNDFGDIWDYSFVDQGSDGDVGPIGLKLEDDKLHFIFFRSLEEKSFIINEDVVINSSLARALGKRNITIKAGQYAVSHDRYQHGESTVSILAD